MKIYYVCSQFAHFIARDAHLFQIVEHVVSVLVAPEEVDVHDIGPVFQRAAPEQRKHCALKCPKVPRIVILEQDHSQNGEHVEHEHQDDSNEPDGSQAHQQCVDDHLQLGEGLDEFQNSKEAEQSAEL